MVVDDSGRVSDGDEERTCYALVTDSSILMGCHLAAPLVSVARPAARMWENEMARPEIGTLFWRFAGGSDSGVLCFTNSVSAKGGFGHSSALSVLLLYCCSQPLSQPYSSVWCRIVAEH
jgi:hypothetical protein